MASTMAPTILLLFSIFILSFSSTSCLNQYHPLDPLTQTEFNQVKTIIQNSYPSQNLTFQYVGLDDPKKSTVLSWNSKSTTKSRPPRRASVVTRLNKQTHEIIVDLSTHSIVSRKVHNGNGYPLLTDDEQTLANELPFKYQPFIQSIKKRGLNISQVVCSGFTVGWFGEKTTKRVIKINSFYTNGTVNLFVRPVEGITLVIDLDMMKIVGYRDRGVVPVPRAEGTEYQASKQKPPFGPQLNGASVLSEGDGFVLNGNTIRLVKLISHL